MIRAGRASVRAKVVGSVLAMAALGMAVAGAVSFGIQDRRLDAAIDAALVQEVGEFAALAETGVDPQTGMRFGSVDQLLAVALQRNVPGPYETYMTLLDGRVHGYSGGDRPVELEKEQQVLDAVADVPAGSDVVILDVSSSVGAVRLAVVQVGVEDGPLGGTYVVASAVDLERAQLLDLTRIYVLVAMATLMMVGGVGWLVAGRLLRPLQLLREGAERISATDLADRIPVRGEDDISQLSRTYNEMLDRLQTSFLAQRQLIDDAGHELRTPVTIISGHLELLDPHDPVAVQETRDLLLDEIDRMRRLIEDLILLAQARRPDFVRVQAVDVAVLTDEVLDKARGLGDRAWQLDAIAEETVQADPQRLTQALLQLCHNAVKFSDEGSPVGIGSASHGGEVHLWVRDQGVGFAPEDAERIFERFGRAETGRGVEGSGLGLSIVAAIAEGHGGTVRAWSTPGQGSRFVLVLPSGAQGTTERAGG